MNFARDHESGLSVVPSHERVHVLEVIGNGIVGGMESCVARLVQRLPRERFRITALCPYDGPFSERLRALGIDCGIAAMPEHASSWDAIQSTCALVRTAGIDVLHAHLPNAHVLAGIVGRMTGRAVLGTIHSRQIGMTELEVHRAADTHLCTVCRASELQVLGVGVERSRLSCIANGIDTHEFRPAPESPQARDQDDSTAAPAAPRTPMIGFVGRLSPEKGPEVFVRAALLLRDRLPNARFVIAGDGPSRERVEALAAQYLLDDRLELLGTRDDMPSVYRGLDVLVSSSHSEALPLAVMEAMACGVPVVATRVGGVPELVAHGSTGWLVEAGDFQGLATAAASLIEQPETHARFAHAARARVVERFDIARHVDAYAALLERLAAVRSGSAGSRLPAPAGSLRALSAEAAGPARERPGIEPDSARS